MNSFLSLVNVMLKNSAMSLQTKRKRSKKWLTYSIGTIFMLGVMYFVTILLYNLFGFLSNDEQRQMMVGLIILVNIIFIFFISFFAAPTYLVFGKDNEFYLSLPIKPAKFLSAKFVLMLIPEYVILSISMIPLIIAYSIYSFNLNFIIFSLIAFIIIPVVPVAISSILSILLLKFVPVFRNQKVYTFVSTLFGIAFSIFFQIASRTMVNDSFIEFLNSSGAVDVASLFKSMFFVNFLVDGIFNANALAILYAIEVAFAAFVIYYLCAKFFYFTIVTSLRFSKSRQKFKKESLNQKSSSVVKKIAGSEIKQMIRTPIFIFNLLITPLLIPVIIGITLFFSSGGPQLNLDSIAFYLNYYLEANFIQQISFSLLAGITSGLFLTTTSTIAATSFTRSKNEITYYQTFPVDAFEIVKGKILFPISFSVALNFIYSLLLLFILKLPILMIIVFNIANLVVTTFCNLMAVLFDLRKPKLNWINEAVAVKQQMNSFYAMALQLVFIGITFWCYFVLFSNNDLGFIIFASVLYFVLVIGMYLILKRVSPAFLQRINQD